MKSTALQTASVMKAELAKTTDLDTVRDVVATADALKRYSRQVGESREVQNEWAEVSIRAGRRAGELLARKVERGRPKKGNTALPLSDLGITKMQSHRWQRLAGIEESDFEAYFALLDREEDEATMKGVLRLAPKQHGKRNGATPLTGETITIQDHIDKGNVFSTFYVDPPWPYGNQGTRAATSSHYKTMTLDDIMGEQVDKICADQAHLHLWTTNAFLFDAKAVMDAWGFEFKSVLIWNKPQVGIGNYWRVNHEYLLLGIKGGMQFTDSPKAQKARLHSVIEHDRIGHSRKPEVFRTLLETVSPGPYIEGYARIAVPDWGCWGDQIERTLQDAITNKG